MRLTLCTLAVLTAFTVPLRAQVSGGRTGDQPGIHRRLLIDEPTVQAVRAIYEPGVAEPAGPHAYDVVLLPLTEGVVKLNIAGRPDPLWKPGEAIFIKRGTEHRLVNVGSASIEFITVRIP